MAVQRSGEFCIPGMRSPPRIGRRTLLLRAYMAATALAPSPPCDFAIFATRCSRLGARRCPLHLQVVPILPKLIFALLVIESIPAESLLFLFRSGVEGYTSAVSRRTSPFGRRRGRRPPCGGALRRTTTPSASSCAGRVPGIFAPRRASSSASGRGISKGRRRRALSPPPFAVVGEIVLRRGGAVVLVVVR